MFLPTNPPCFPLLRDVLLLAKMYYYCFFETGFLCVAVLELVDQTIFKLRDLLASASTVLGLRECANTLRSQVYFLLLRIMCMSLGIVCS